MAISRFFLHRVARGTAAALLGLSALAGVFAAAPAQAAVPAADRPFVYGVTIADASAGGHSFDLARQAGFTHAYVVLNWGNVEPQRGRFAWDSGQANDLDNFLAAARASGMRLIVRLSQPPAWAGSPATLSPADMESFAAGVASRARGVAAAYEVLNEPNLAYEWGGTPNPAGYAQLLAAASRGIKSADGSALVVAAGLAPHTGGQAGTIEDVDFLRGMYAAGARGTFDVLGIHPYGGNSTPDQDPASCGICFRRAELYRQVMVESGDSATSAWVTEFGYLYGTSLDLGQYNWLKLAPDQQAGYLTAAFQYGYQNWPWLSGMVAFNLDFDTVSWNPPTLGAYWFSLLNPDHTPRPVYQAILNMAKPGAGSPLPTSSAPASSAPAPSVPAAAPSAATAPTSPTTAAPKPVPISLPASQGTRIVCTTSGHTAICGPADLAR